MKNYVWIYDTWYKSWAETQDGPKKKKTLITFNSDDLSPFPKSCKCIFWAKLQLKVSQDSHLVQTFLKYYHFYHLSVALSNHFTSPLSSLFSERVISTFLPLHMSWPIFEPANCFARVDIEPNFPLQSMWYTVLCALRLCTYKNIAYERQTNSR